MFKGSYLFESDAQRIIQDPESLRASSIRQASAWEAWAALKDAVMLQANSSDHNPAVMVGSSPQDSWELATPQLMRFYVKGGPHSHGQHGYIVSNANWDPYPMANRIENFVIALANMDVAVMLRIERFRNPFFTGVKLSEILPEAARGFYEYSPVDLEQEMQTLMNPVAPLGAPSSARSRICRRRLASRCSAPGRRSRRRSTFWASTSSRAVYGWTRASDRMGPATSAGLPPPPGLRSAG